MMIERRSPSAELVGSSAVLAAAPAALDAALSAPILGASRWHARLLAADLDIAGVEDGDRRDVEVAGYTDAAVARVDEAVHCDQIGVSERHARQRATPRDSCPTMARKA